MSILSTNVRKVFRCMIFIFGAVVALLPAYSQALPPQKAQPTSEKVLAEHFAALHACDWNRMMAGYDDNIAFLSNGDVVSGRQAVGEMFKKVLQPHSKGGLCGMKMTPERMIVVGNTVNVVFRFDAPFFAEPYHGAEAFEIRNGLVAVQITTFDQAAVKMTK